MRSRLLSLSMIALLFFLAFFSNNQSYSLAIDEKVVKVYYENPKIISECIQADFNIIAVYPTYFLSSITPEQEIFLQTHGLYFIIEEDTNRIYFNGYEFISLIDKSIRWIPTNSVPDPSLLSSDLTEQYFVQFIGPEKEEWLSALCNLTVTLIMPLHKNAWLVMVDPAIAQNIFTLPFVKSFASIPLGSKIYPELLKQPEIQLADITIKGGQDLDFTKFITTFFLNGSQCSTCQTEFFTYITVKDFQKLELVRLAKYPHLYEIVPYVENEPLNERASRVVRINQFNSVSGHNENMIDGLDGAGEIVGIADTGIVSNHPDFWNPTFNNKVIATYPSFNWIDTNGHGSHVTGTIAGTGALSPNNQLKGMAFNANIVAQNYLSNQSYYTSYDQIFQEIYDAGARIQNNSWGPGGFNFELLGSYQNRSRSFDRFSWDKMDYTLIKSAGNDRDTAFYYHYFPYGQKSIKDGSTAKNVISVGATENETGSLSSFPATWGRTECESDRLAGYSSVGPTHDGRIKPDVVAPGDGLWSVRRKYGTGGAPYTEMSGTSMAAPVVTGSCALIRQYFRTRELIPENNISSALIKAVLINGCTQGLKDSDKNTFYFANPFPLFPNPFTGFGRINLKQSLYPNGLDLLYINAYDSVNKDQGLWDGGRYDTYYFKVNNPSSPIKATLVWTDYADELFPPDAGPTNPGKDIINDLNLEIFNYQSQNYYRGNQFNGAYSKVNPDHYDHINNVEQVNISQDASGYYRVSVNTLEDVRSDFEHGDRQPYALVITGGEITWVNPSEVPFQDLSITKMDFATKTQCSGNYLQWSKPNVLLHQTTYYKIHRIQFGCGEYGTEMIFTINSTDDTLEFLDQDIQYNCMYGYFVEAFDNKQQSIAITPMLESGFVIPPAPPSPYPPIVNSDYVHLYWNNPKQGTCAIEYYVIYRSEDPETLGELIATLHSIQKSYFDYAVERGKTYYYYLRSIDSRTLYSLYSKKIQVKVPMPESKLDLSVEISKKELCAEDDFSVKVIIYNQTNAVAKQVTLTISPNYDLRYVRADKLIAQLQPDRSVLFVIPDIPAYSQYSFTTYFVVESNIVQEKSSFVLFALDQANLTITHKEVRPFLKKCSGSDEPIQVSIRMLNLHYDNETGQYYLPKENPLNMLLKISSVTFPYLITIHWGDGEKVIVKPETGEVTLNHQYETKGRMSITIDITDSAGKAKSASCSISVR